MGFNYANAQSTALRLIKQFGVIGKLYNSTSTYNPVTGVTTPTAVDSTDATIVSLPVSESKIDGLDTRFREELKKFNARFFYMAASGLSFQPAPGHFLTFDGKVFEIVGVSPLNPAGTPVIFSIGAKESLTPEAELAP